MKLKDVALTKDARVYLLFSDMPVEGGNFDLKYYYCRLVADEPATFSKYYDFVAKYPDAEVEEMRLMWYEGNPSPTFIIRVAGVYDEIWSLPENQKEEDEPVEEDTPATSEAELTNADRIRSMSDEELADFLIFQEVEAQEGAAWEVSSVCLRWLQSTDKEVGGYFDKLE